MNASPSPAVILLLLLVAVLGYLLLWLQFRIREAEIRRDAIERSRSVVAGKATEHLAALLPEFSYDPRDVRFLGSPVDLVVFDGLSEGEIREIVFLEVKTGPTAALSTRERRIRDVVNEGRVRWEELRVPLPDRVLK